MITEGGDDMAQPRVSGSFDRETAELDKTRLLWVKFKPELTEACPECIQAGFRVGLALEPNHKVVNVADHNDVLAAALLSPLLDPQIQDIMKVHVCQ